MKEQHTSELEYTDGSQLMTVQLTMFLFYNGVKVICIINYMRYSMLQYQIGCVLDGFAQL